MFDKMEKYLNIISNMFFLNVLNPDIAFDGWAIALIVLSLSTLVGGGTYLAYHKISQKQKAGNKAKQKQNVRASQSNKHVSQKQEAGDYSNQSQIA